MCFSYLIIDPGVGVASASAELRVRGQRAGFLILPSLGQGLNWRGQARWINTNLIYTYRKSTR